MPAIQIPDDSNGIMLISDAPSEEEIKTIRHNPHHDMPIGRAFSDANGFYFRQAAKAISFPIDKCFITYCSDAFPVIKGAFDSINDADQYKGRKALEDRIVKYKPKLLVAIGEHALRVLTGCYGIDKYRGSLLPCKIVEGYRVFCTLHPTDVIGGKMVKIPKTEKFKRLFGDPQLDILLKMDLNKALTCIDDSHEIDRRIDVIYSEGRALKALYDLSYLSRPVTVDIETAGSRLLAYGVATSPTEAMVIPKELFKSREIFKALSEFANSPVPKIFHNALYDVFYMAYYYKIYHRNIFFDTMLAQHAIFPTLRKSLAFCSSLYTYMPYWKDEGKEVTKDYSPNKIIDWEQFYIYNGKDCCVTHEIWEKQEEELNIWGTRPIFNLMMRAIDPALISMYQGFLLDHNEIERFKNENEKVIAILERIKQGSIGDVNFASPKQCKELLYDNWKLPKQKNKGVITTDDKALAFLESLPTNVQHFLGLIQHSREHLKLRGFYNLTVDPDQRLRFSQKIHGAYTGRWATSKSITGSGLNLQNQPKVVRDIYKADQGKIFIQWDLSNADARFVAACCQDENWLRAFDIEDQHAVVASELFGIPKEDVRKKYSGDKTYRDFGKKIAHATHYLEQANKLAITLGCSRIEAQKHINKYKQQRPMLQEWHTRVNVEISKTRIIRTAFGRVIQFFGPRFEQRLPDVVACEPQSLSSDYLTTGLMDCIEQIPELEFRLQVHDSGLFLVDDDVELLKTILPQVKQIMEKKITVHGLDLRIPIDIEIGYHWGSLKKVPSLDMIDEVYKEVKDDTCKKC